MKTNKTLLPLLSVLFLVSAAFTSPASKWISQKTHVHFFSHTEVEDIEANNFKSVSTLDPTTGDVVFSVPMQSFEFEKSLMQKHFNAKKFLNTKQFPKAKFKGKITNLPEINFSKDGTYTAMVEGDMTIKDKTNKVKTKGSVTVKGNTISIESKFPLTLADYGIAFEDGKPSTNIAKTIDITIKADYKSE